MVKKTLRRVGGKLGNAILKFPDSASILTHVFLYRKFASTTYPPFEMPLGNQFTMELEKKNRFWLYMTFSIRICKKMGIDNYQQKPPDGPLNDKLVEETL